MKEPKTIRKHKHIYSRSGDLKVFLVRAGSYRGYDMFRYKTTWMGKTETKHYSLYINNRASSRHFKTKEEVKRYIDTLKRPSPTTAIKKVKRIR